MNRPRFDARFLAAAALISLGVAVSSAGAAADRPNGPESAASPAAAKPLAWWSFDRDPAVQPGGRTAVPPAALDSVSGRADPIRGNFRLVRGVSGDGLKLDGYTTAVVRDSAAAPRLDGAFSLEAWIALAAYPWNRCPIAARLSGDAGFSFGVGPRGELSFTASDEGEWLDCVSAPVLPLRTWVHVAAVYDPATGIRLFADGRLVRETARPSRFKPAAQADLILGSVVAPVRPSHAVGRGEGTLPSWFSLDAILDDVKLHGGALSDADLRSAVSAAAAVSAADPDGTASRTDRGRGADSATVIGAPRTVAPALRARPDIPPRVMPSGPPDSDRGPGPFGAVYANLDYYWEWDDLWRVGDHPDVVVRFEHSPIRVVFWRGLRYSPAWVTENGIWVADQSAESGNAEGCIEHMQDIHCQYSHVRILESTPARAVVHWRYAPVSSRDHRWLADPRTGWDWWIDETYTFFPDGTAVRKMEWREPPAPESRLPWIQIQETSILCHPGQNAKDVLERQAITLLNLAGERRTYGWPDDDTVNTRERRNMAVDPSMVRRIEPAGASIQVVHSRAASQSFIAFEPPKNRFRVYVGRVRDELANFPAYNHWPVNQTASDGRFAQAADRASSFSIAQGHPVIREGEQGLRWTRMLYGMRRMDEPAAAAGGGFEAVLAAARSWANPPAMTTSGEGFQALGYDASQRAYVWRREKAGSALKAVIEASNDAPIENLSLVIEGWNDAGAEVLLDGRPMAADRVRFGRLRRLEGDGLVVWIEHRSTRPVALEIRGAPGH